MQDAHRSYTAPTSLKEWDQAFSSMRGSIQRTQVQTAGNGLKKLADMISRVSLLRKRIQGQNIEILDQAQEREFITDPKEKGLLYWSEQYAMLAEDHQLQNYQVKAMQFWVGMLDNLTGSSHLGHNTQKSFSRAEAYKQKLETIIEDQKANMARLTVQQKEYEVALDHMTKHRKQEGKPNKVAESPSKNTLQLHKKSLQSKRNSMETLAIRSDSPAVAEKTHSPSTLRHAKSAAPKPRQKASQRPHAKHESPPPPSVESVLQNAKQLLQELDN